MRGDPHELTSVATRTVAERIGRTSSNTTGGRPKRCHWIGKHPPRAVPARVRRRRGDRRRAARRARNPRFDVASPHDRRHVVHRGARPRRTSTKVRTMQPCRVAVEACQPGSALEVRGVLVVRVGVFGQTAHDTAARRVGSARARPRKWAVARDRRGHQHVVDAVAAPIPRRRARGRVGTACRGRVRRGPVGRSCRSARTCGPARWWL